MHPVAVQAARQAQTTPEFKALYAKRASIEGTLSEGTRTHDLRRSRYVGLARTHLQHLFTALAINWIRVGQWLAGRKQATTRISAFAGFRCVGAVLIDDFASSIYHSKYNPIERVWGILEQHWNGDLLDSRQTVLRLASTMTYHGLSPLIHLVETVYQTGIHLSARAMAGLEQRFERLTGLEKWFVRIVPSPS